MKTLFTILWLFLIAFTALSQNITNTLDSNGVFSIKDGTTTYFSLFQSTGNVGIGVMNPLSKFDVNGDAQIRGNLSLSVTNPYIAFYDNGYIQSYDDNHRITFDRQNNLLKLHEWGDIIFSTTGQKVERMRIANNGNVGIGNTNPTTGKLVVDGSVHAGGYNGTAFRIGDDARLVDIDIANTFGVYGIQDSTRSSIKLGQNGGIISGYNGNIGIGTLTPSYPLEVRTTNKEYAAKFEGDSTGVYGHGYREGILGLAWGNYGAGVYGYGYGNYGSGVYGKANAYGVYGEGNVRGVYGKGYLYGVYGEGNNYGVYAKGGTYSILADGTSSFFGSMLVNGEVIATIINAAQKFFKIDHPLDPVNKYLMHSCVESSEAMNIYNGNIITDGAGFATVKLSNWFEALNKDFRYQLTVIGDFAQAIVSKEIQNNQFEIRTDKPGVKVSWQVTGVRHDAYVEKHPMQVEVEKAGEEKGKYLSPDAFGLPETMGISYQHRKRIEEGVNKK